MTTIEDGLDRQVDRPPTRRRHRTTPLPRLAGVEHEYTLAIGDQRVDARRRVDLRGVARPALDPADPNARRLPWGGVVTYDGPELEVVTPPVTIRPGFAGDLAAAAARGRRDLEAVLPAGATIDGFSTHLNVSVTPGSERAVARLFLTHFAAPTMLLLDDAGSPGLLVRPRIDATLAPLALAPRIERAVERFGWYVDRTGFGGDLYVEGRSARLPRAGHGTVSAQDHLAQAWARARAAIKGQASRAELALVDDLVAGGAKLPCERPAERPAPAAATDAPASPPAPASGERPALPALAGPAAGDAPVEAEVPVDGHDPRSASPFGALIRPRVRGPLTITAEVVTWRFAVFEVTDGTARCHLSATPAPVACCGAREAVG